MSRAWGWARQKISRFAPPAVVQPDLLPVPRQEFQIEVCFTPAGVLGADLRSGQPRQEFIQVVAYRAVQLSRPLRVADDLVPKLVQRLLAFDGRRVPRCHSRSQIAFRSQ